MFDKKYEERLTIWRKFRDGLEFSEDPIQDTIDFYKQAPMCSIATDPYNPDNWPDPWELLEENNYCPFVKILAICYTLQLTDVLSQASYEIHITQDNVNSVTHYLLYVDDYVVGFNGDNYMHSSDLKGIGNSELIQSMSLQQ
jgi:hypothetical protein